MNLNFSLYFIKLSSSLRIYLVLFEFKLMLNHVRYRQWKKLNENGAADSAVFYIATYAF